MHLPAGWLHYRTGVNSYTSQYCIQYNNKKFNIILNFSISATISYLYGDICCSKLMWPFVIYLSESTLKHIALGGIE